MPLFGRRLQTPATAADAVNELRQQISSLEADLDAANLRIAEIRAQAAAAEDRAMQSIRAGDDRAARDALVEQQALAEEVGRLDVDSQAVREVLAECHEFLRRWSDAAEDSH